MRALILAVAAPLSLGAVPSGITLEGAAAQGGLIRGRAPAGTVALALDGGAVPFAPDGGFLIAFDRDAPPRATLTAVSGAGVRTVLPLRVAAVAWPVRRLPTLPRGTPRTPQAIAARAAEVARIAASRSRLQPVEGWRQRFRWPITGRISGLFGAETIYAGEPGGFHSGVDVARPAGAMVTAPADGVVVLTSPPAFSVEGNLVIIDHGMALSSAFLHLARSHVRLGEVVRQGQPIGTVGATGRATGPHLHWGMKWRNARIDPQRLVGTMPER